MPNFFPCWPGKGKLCKEEVTLGVQGGSAQAEDPDLPASERGQCKTGFADGIFLWSCNRVASQTPLGKSLTKKVAYFLAQVYAVFFLPLPISSVMPYFLEFLYPFHPNIFIQFPLASNLISYVSIF